MKQLISIALFFVLCISSTGLAEQNFTLRSNLQFGMTLEEVMQCESTAGVEIRTSFSDEASSGYSWCTSYISVAGYEKTKTYYAFDESNGLCSVLYDFPTIRYTAYEDGKISSKEVYDLSMAASLREKLITLYGEPTAYTDYKAHPNSIDFVDNDIRSQITFLKEYTPFYYKSKGDMKSGYDVKEIDQWIIKTDHGYVDIQLFHYQYYCGHTLVSFVASRSSYSLTKEYEGLALSYTFLPAEAIENMNRSIDSDL